MPNAQGSKNQVLRHLREDEGEAVHTTPPAGIAAARVEPTTAITAIRREEARTATSFDGLVHDDDPPKPHGFELLVREHLTDQAGNFGVRGREFHLSRLVADLLGDAIAVAEEQALQNCNFVSHTRRRLEVIGQQNLPGIGRFDAEAFLLETLDPLLAGCAVGGDGEVDDAVGFAPALDRLGHLPLAGIDAPNSLVGVRDLHLLHQILDEGVQFTGQHIGDNEFLIHDGLHRTQLCVFIFLSSEAEPWLLNRFKFTMARNRHFQGDFWPKSINLSIQIYHKITILSMV